MNTLWKEETLLYHIHEEPPASEQIATTNTAICQADHSAAVQALS